MRVDLHAHTRYSRDSTLNPREFVARARAVGLDRIAVTDHNTIEGALEAKAIDHSLVIVGEEVDTRERTHLIGLFLREEIPAGLPVREVADRIREQGGVVYAPHPFAYLRAAKRHAREAMLVADVVEVFNARAFLPVWNRRAYAAAQELGIPVAASTDAHFSHEIGAAWTDLPAFTSIDEFRASITSARPVALRTQTPLIHCVSYAIETARGAAGLFGRTGPRGLDA
jgi:predicted metal-dependent phosphoesterase TrpH